MDATAATLTVLLLVPATKPEPQQAPAPGIRQTLANMDYGAGTVSIRTPMSRPTAPAPQRSMARKVVGGLLGGVGGFVAGALIGSSFTQDCRCDDPGLKGAVYGAPIGALLGAMIGAKFF